MSEVTEKVYHDGSGITVTSSRFINGSTTYAMRNVSAVTMKSKGGSVGFPITMVVLGLLMLTSPAWLVGIAIAAGGGALIVRAKPTYSVVLTTSGNDLAALESKNKTLIESVVKALNQSIIDRG